MKNHNAAEQHLQRRKFITDLGAIAGIALIAGSPMISSAESLITAKDITAGEIIDLFISKQPYGVLQKTVDTIKAGNRDMKVKGIVTTMFATIDVIRKAIDLNANFIIAHEPTFYNHLDDTEWLVKDDVYLYKEKLLRNHGITVWRNHDYIHSMQPDGVGTGLLKQLSWESYFDEKKGLLNLPSTSLNALINLLKAKLKINTVRYIGDLKQECERVLFLPGAAGGTTQITATARLKPDVLIVGEIQEWETAEYIRDAGAKGDSISLIILGHIASEEPGSEFMVEWLHKNFPSLKSTHIPSGNSLSFI